MRIRLFENSANGVKSTSKRKYNPSNRYRDIIEKTNERIRKYHDRLELVYERAKHMIAE